MKHHSIFTTVKMPLYALATAILLGGATPINAEDVMDSSSKALLGRFELGNVCKPINLLVEAIDSNEEAMGLTRKAIITTVRSRLRAARLYKSGREPYRYYLYVNVNTLDPAFTIKVQFNKMFTDPISGVENSAITWDKGTVGKAPNATYILSVLAELTDEFIDEYLQVNAPDCPRGPLDP